MEVSFFTIKKKKWIGKQKKWVRKRNTFLKETLGLTGIYSWDQWWRPCCSC
jgi:hypothetical protein